MDYSYIANSGLADCELGNICIDYANSCIFIDLNTPKGNKHILKIPDFEEIIVVKKEHWGKGKYVVASDCQHCGDKNIIEIQLNSGDLIKITTQHDIFT